MREEKTLKKKKLLYILNIANKVNNFSYTSMIAAQELGIEFHIAGNWSYKTDEERLADEQKYGIKIHQIDFVRTPYHPGNLKAYNQLKQILKEENYDFIHCNTPVGGVLGRLVGKKYNIKKIIYQAHGFHFYKGAPKINWLIYYPVEKLLARYTDALITINKEDYEFAKSKLKLRNNGKVYYVPGVGIDVLQNKIDLSLREVKREELCIPMDAFVLISVGELNTNKNNKVIVSAMAKNNDDNVHYVVCGIGPAEKDLREQVDAAGLQNNVHFVGYRNDIKEMYQMADCFVMPSFREGLSRSIMEAMASGLPCIVSKIRGNVDLIEKDKNGFLCETTNASEYAEKITILANNAELCKKMSSNNLLKIKKFSKKTIIRETYQIYDKEFIN